MSRPYTWEEIKYVLVQELNKTKNIMTFGTIGSCNVEHDIDLIITKNPKSKSSDFYKEIHNIFDNLDIYLKKYGAKSVRAEESESIFLMSALENYNNSLDLAFHTLIYTSLPQMEKHWSCSIFPNENIKEILMSIYNCLYGDINNMFKGEFTKATYYDSVLIYASFYDFFNSHLPDKLFLEMINHYIDFIYRKKLNKLKLKYSPVKNLDEAKNYFYKLLDIIDNLNKKHKH